MAAALEVVDGTQLTFEVGGQLPTTATVRLTGGSIPLEGEFEKGETLTLRVEAVVRELDFVDQVDPKTKTVVGCERRQKASITGVERID